MIRKVNTYWQTNNPAEVRSFWDNAAYHTGNMEVYKLLQDQQMLDYSIRWAEHNQWKGATEPDPANWKYKQYGEGQDYVLFGDWQICFQTYIDLYNLSPDEEKVARAKEVMGYEVYFIYPVMRTHKAVFTIDEPTITITGHSTRPIPASYAGNKNNAVDPRTPGLHVTQVRDCALFQTFPLDFKIYGGKQDATQQMGNAVPVKLAEAIGKAVMEYEALESKAKSIETFF